MNGIVGMFLVFFIVIIGMYCLVERGERKDKIEMERIKNDESLKELYKKCEVLEDNVRMANAKYNVIFAENCMLRIENDLLKGVKND